MRVQINGPLNWVYNPYLIQHFSPGDNFFDRSVQRSLYINEFIYTKSKCLIKAKSMFDVVNNLNTEYSVNLFCWKWWCHRYFNYNYQYNSIIRTKPTQYLHILKTEWKVRNPFMIVTECSQHKMPLLPILLSIWWNFEKGLLLLISPISIQIPCLLPMSNTFRSYHKSYQLLQGKLRFLSYASAYLTSTFCQLLQHIFISFQFWLSYRRTWNFY